MDPFQRARRRLAGPITEALSGPLTPGRDDPSGGHEPGGVVGPGPLDEPTGRAPMPFPSGPPNDFPTGDGRRFPQDGQRPVPPVSGPIEANPGRGLPSPWPDAPDPTRGPVTHVPPSPWDEGQMSPGPITGTPLPSAPTGPPQEWPPPSGTRVPQVPRSRYQTQQMAGGLTPASLASFAQMFSDPALVQALRGGGGAAQAHPSAPPLSPDVMGQLARVLFLRR